MHVYLYVVHIHILHIHFYSIPIPLSISHAATSLAFTLSRVPPLLQLSLCIYNAFEIQFFRKYISIPYLSHYQYRVQPHRKHTLSWQSRSPPNIILYIQCFCTWNSFVNAFTFHIYPPVHIARIHIASAHSFLSIPPPHNLWFCMHNAFVNRILSSNTFTFHTYPPIHIARSNVASAHSFIIIPPPDN